MNQTQIGIEVRGFSFFSKKGIGKLVLENELEKLELEILEIKSAETDALDYNCKTCFDVTLSNIEAIKFFSFLTQKEHKKVYMAVRNISEGIYIQELNPDSQINLNFENMENEERNGLCFSEGLKFNINFGYFWRAEWQQNIARLRFLPRKIDIK